MNLDDIKIVFDEPSCTYRPGQLVTGYISVNLKLRSNFRSIRMTIKGEARTRWKEVINVENGKEVWRTSSGQEVYFSTGKSLVQSENGSEIELPKGEHVYPFNHMLPMRIPSSFQHKYGNISYILGVIIDCPDKVREKKKKFTVISDLDLNREYTASEPFSEEINKIYKGLMCRTLGLLHIKVNMPVNGFVPSQQLPLQIKVENRSSVEIKSIKVALQRIITFRTTNPHCAKRRMNIEAEIIIGPFAAQKTSFSTETLEIPITIASKLEHCRLIDVTYRLITIAYPRKSIFRKYMELKTSGRIIIGTLPLERFVPTTSPSYQTQQSLSDFFNRTENYTSSWDRTNDDYYYFYHGSQSSDSSTRNPPPSYNSVINTLLPRYDDCLEIPPPSYEEISSSDFRKSLGVLANSTVTNA